MFIIMKHIVYYCFNSTHKCVASIIKILVFHDPTACGAELCASFLSVFLSVYIHKCNLVTPRQVLMITFYSLNVRGRPYRY